MQLRKDVQNTLDTGDEMKKYQEFIQEAKKCWPGYKKKGTQKLFGKTYNRCVKEDIISFAKRQEKKGKGIGPKPSSPELGVVGQELS